MCYSNPELLDALLTHLSDQMAAYVKYQIESGAQCVQVQSVILTVTGDSLRWR